MAISNKLNDAKNALETMKKNKRYKKNNATRQELVELQVSLGKCRGQLEMCSKDLNHTIRQKSKSIREGQAVGADTVMHEQILWDAAIAYLLVKDAIFTLKTISDADSIAYAYDMLDAASDQLSGKKPKFSVLNNVGAAKERNSYGYLTSKTKTKEKELLLESVFEELKMTGDIEGCIANAGHPSAVQADRIRAYSGTKTASAPSGSMEEFAAFLSNTSGNMQDEDYDFDVDSLTDIHPPKH